MPKQETTTTELSSSEALLLLEHLRRLYPDCNGNISIANDGGLCSNGTIDELIYELEAKL